ncbi:MBL fold metallo-hydrolase [Algoriphagus sp. Y33]|uniref:MBL fold metallo-hydrolase n=1 Tax=Algoriphagus sp. Y33 TaxID=2772483 RepID=UPI001784BFE6|nr:MBL fold metallo-hydrolase [Algoriphagus sp. Y33]
MDIKITMLDVKDGDAIIVELKKSNKELVMVIDGGEPNYYKAKVKPQLEAILKIHNKKAPDIVVCTHYDSDHIGGLIPLIEDYISDIKEVWVHRTPELLKGFIEKAILLSGQFKHNTFNNIEAFKSSGELNKLFESYEQPQKSIIEEKTNLIIESLPQLKKLIDLIPPSKLNEVFYKQRPLVDWQEIVVLGPTKEYYSSLFPSTKSFEQFIIEESLDLETFPIEKGKNRMLELAGTKPCDILKTDGQTRLTATNKASIILAIDKEDKRYLFTGDAGIESFKSIPDWETELENLFFLKIPHHASDNNISKELIELMRPEYAYNTGFKYQDDAVLKCLEQKDRNKSVKTTKTDGDLIFDK